MHAQTIPQLVKALGEVVGFTGWHTITDADHGVIEKQARFKPDPSQHSAVFILVSRSLAAPVYVSRTPANLFEHIDTKFGHSLLTLYFASPEAADSAAWKVLRHCGTVYDKAHPGYCKNAVIFAPDGSAWIAPTDCGENEYDCVAANGWFAVGEVQPGAELPQPMLGKARRESIANLAGIADMQWPKAA